MDYKLTLTLFVLFFMAVAQRADSQELLEREQTAREFYARGDWRASARAWGNLATENPDRPALWQNYAYSLHSSGQYADAVGAWERALELGFRPRTTLYNLACAESKNGNIDSALARLGEALEAGWQYDELLWNDEDLDPLRELKAFQDITGIAPPIEADRLKRWAYDLKHLVRRMEMLHYDLYARMEQDRLENELTELKERIGSLDDSDILIEVQRIAALVGDGHTAVDLVVKPFHEPASVDNRPAPLYLPPREYPVDFYYFSDGLFVRGARKPAEDLSGYEVQSIGGLEVDEALARIAPYCSSDNAMRPLFQAPLLLALPDVARAAGLTDHDGRLVLSLIAPDSSISQVALSPVPMASTAERFVRLSGTGGPNSSARLPDYLMNPTSPFWWKLDKGSRLVYFQMNMVAEPHGPSLEDTCREMFEALDGQVADTLVIDLRNNVGGDATLLRPLIHGVIRNNFVNRHEHLYVITGRRTFSAAVNLVNQLERETEAIFVGEPPASGPNFVGERSILTLPYSGMRISVSSLYWQDSDPRDGRIWVAPDIPTPMSSADWLTNRDPAMEMILRQLGR